MDKGSEQGSPANHSYRAKLIHDDGSIETTIAIMAANETEALIQVRGLSLSYSVELWDAGQLVTTIPMRRF